MSNETNKPVNQPTNGQTSQVKGLPPQKRRYWLWGLIVVVILALGIIVYQIFLKEPSETGTNNSSINMSREREADFESAPGDGAGISNNPTGGESGGSGRGRQVGDLQPQLSGQIIKNQYIFQPVICCILIIINIIISATLISKYKVTKKEDPIKKLLKELKDNMGKWVAEIQDIRLEASKNEGMRDMLVTLGTNNQRLKNLAETIDKDRSRIPTE